MSFKRALKLLPKVGERTAATFWTAVAEAPDPVAAFLRARPGQGAGRRARGAPTLRRDAEDAAHAVVRRPRRPRRSATSSTTAGYARRRDGRSSRTTRRASTTSRRSRSSRSPYDGVRDASSRRSRSSASRPARRPVAGEDDDERLVLSSVHQAKGLEWKAVFVIGLHGGPLPEPAGLRARPRGSRRSGGSSTWR